MSRRKLAVAAGALVVVVGGAAAIAAVGQHGDRMGHLGFADEFGGPLLAQGYGRDMGMGMGMGDRDGRHGAGMGPGGGRGFMGRGRSMSAEDFDARTRERFARLDKNSDGVIDAAEVEAEIDTRAQGRGGIVGAMRQRFQGQADANRDGKVERREMLDRVKRAFTRMDLDGDGRITDADLPPPMRGRDVLKGGDGDVGRRMGGGMIGRLRAADANKDGVVTAEEMATAAGRRFDQADRNKDGVLDQTDRDAARKEMTEYRVKRFLHAYGAGADGKISRDQFFKAAKERFAEMDHNHDGRLDRQDRMGGRGPGGERGDRGPGGGQGMGPGMGQGMGQGMGPGGPGMRDRSGPQR